MSLTDSLSDLQISIPFFVPSVSEQGPGLALAGPRVCVRPGQQQQHPGLPGEQESQHHTSPSQVSPSCPHTHPSPLKQAQRGELAKEMVGAEVI